jgi:hypothetical protein
MGRVIIFESDPDVRELLLRFVGHLGYDASTGDDGEKPGAVLLEPGDPGLSARARRLVEADPGLPVVCASIYPKSPETTSLKPVAYLTKPVRLPELRAALSVAFESA